MSGFGFGNSTAPASTAASFSLPNTFTLPALSSATNPTTTASSGGLGGSSFGKPATSGITMLPSGGFTMPGFSLNAATTTSSQGFGGFSSAATTQSTAGTTGFGLGGSTATSTATTNTGGFSLGGLGGSAATNPSSSTSGGLTLGAATTTTASSGLSLGKPATSFSFGTPTTSATSSASGGFSLGSLTSTTTTTSSGGLTLGKLLGSSTTSAPTTTSSALTLGGLGGTSGQTQTTKSSEVKGLGGVDPKTDPKSSTSSAGKAGDGKSVKESNMPNELVGTVTKFKEYVKEQKEVKEKIMMVSSQAMYKVKDQTSTLKHLLSTVATGLQRNAVAIEKLKKQTSQELHYVEMAHRTKETPPGLQYENTSPTEYFHHLLESFDSRMVLYRKLIEDTEGYLLAAQQGAVISPRDLFICLKRLHDTLIALAAELQGVHERVKEQKEHYLAYRKVFHHDETDVFAQRKKTVDKSKMKRTAQPLGPTPFTGLSNYAAMMMSAAMNRQNAPPAQQPGTTVPFGAITQPNQPPTGGLFGGTGFGFGSSNTATTSFSGFGASNPTTTGGFKGFQTFNTPTTSTGTTGFGTAGAFKGFQTFNTPTTSAGTAGGFKGFQTFNTPTTSTGTAGAFKGFQTLSTPATSTSTGTTGFGTSGGFKGFQTFNTPTTGSTTGTTGFGSTSFGATGFGSTGFGSKPLGVATPQSLTASAPSFESGIPNKRK